MLVGRRALPALLAVIAAAADARGAHGLAFDALLAAVPFTAVTALVCVRRVPRASRRARWAASSRCCGASRSRSSFSRVPRARLLPRPRRSRRSAPRRSPPASSCSGSSSCWRRLRTCGACHCTPQSRNLVAGEAGNEVQNGSAAAAECATSISGWTAKNEPTVTATQIATPRPSRSSRGGEPPAGASCSSAASRKYMARTIPR